MYTDLSSQGYGPLVHVDAVYLAGYPCDMLPIPDRVARWIRGTSGGSTYFSLVGHPSDVDFILETMGGRVKVQARKNLGIELT